MKKILSMLYLFIMALFVFSMSGCGGSGGGVQTARTQQSLQSRRMIVTSRALKRDGSYNIFRGNQVGIIGTTAKYYVAPVTRGSEDITLNLEFFNSISDDVPFIITENGSDTDVIFAYNPSGSGIDTTTPYGEVNRYGGAAQKMTYTNLEFATSSINLESDDQIFDIVLNSDGTATIDGSTIPSYEFVWHADPQHPTEYWTLGDGTTEYSADDYEAAITSTISGLYIAHDVRYMSNTLEFSTSNTAKKDEDTEYVVYYDMSSSAVSEAVAALGTTYGSAYSSDKYIFATLPMQVAGMGGMPGGEFPGGGEVPGGNMPGGGGGPNPPNFASFSSAADTSSIPAFSTMTHSAAEAYNNPVLHITEPGTYRLSGTWKGQIWVELGAKVKHQARIILDGVDVECTVAPAIVFYKVYKWAENGGMGYDTQSVLAANNLWKNIGAKMISDDTGDYDVGALVEIADGTTNKFTGTNLYRILELCPKLDDDTNLPKYTGSGIGTDISEQEKMYKLDGAFHSRRTMVIGGGANGTGTLTINSTYEGLDSEMHLFMESGIINVTASDDAINVNEDYVSVFQMDSGTLTINSTGGDGIDSNGWVSIQGGTLNITAGTTSQDSAGEAGIDAENGVDISGNAVYNYSQASNNGGGGAAPGGESGESSTSGNQSGTDTSTNTNTNTNSNTNSDTSTNTNSNTSTVTETTVTIGGDTVFTLFPEETTIQIDTEGVRNIPSSSNIFRTVHKINDFGGIKQ